MVSRTPEPPCGGRGASFIASCGLRHDTAKAARQRYDSNTTDELLGRNSSLVRLCGPPSQFEITRARPIDTNLSTARLATGPSPSHIHSEYPGSLGTREPSGNTIGGPFASRSTCSRTNAPDLCRFVRGRPAQPADALRRPPLLQSMHITGQIPRIGPNERHLGAQRNFDTRYSTPITIAARTIRIVSTLRSWLSPVFITNLR